MVKNLALLWLSLAVLPMTTFIILTINMWHRVTYGRKKHHAKLPGALRKTILVTGVSAAKGLTIARLFHRAGHTVIGADFHSLSPGSVSTAIGKYYRLPAPEKTRISNGEDVEDAPYTLELLRIVREQNVDLWIPASEPASAVQDALVRDMMESQTCARPVQLRAKHVRTLSGKDSFMRYTRNLELPTPDTELVRSKADVIDFLTQRGGLNASSCQNIGASSKRYILRPVGDTATAPTGSMPLLPLASERETIQCIEDMPLLEGDEYIMQEHLQGHEFLTHALVVRGRVRAFVACPSSETAMHYQTLPQESPFSRFMLNFTQTIADEEGPEFTGHIGFTFMAKSWSGGDSKHEDVHVYPIKCHPSVQIPAIFFRDTPELVGEYLSVLDSSGPHRPEEEDGEDGDNSLVLYPQNPKTYYWMGQDLMRYLFAPTAEKISGDPRDVVFLGGNVASLIDHVRNWKDPVFETWDPWPWWWLYHVYWPTQVARNLFWGKWHRGEVSLREVFQ
ncbi:hypothetical protein ACRE_035540 [Hapsidospora chrysogenum ATCC 11550]|uniref:Uncharacterized protein n=1 Tax=Hapsidospora chrysogenum (strain ATCC 11550 / CBS 779.69 / DSM 880 / IAM 14645 / JCM 23072 / IMI 49137) TaxID=857340 RepID=A0A086T8F0_HAPC1|nr:hypothetical protein ACRE_035540 [Hapsidospora chrysogenum ATCC 11550]